MQREVGNGWSGRLGSHHRPQWKHGALLDRLMQGVLGERDEPLEGTAVAKLQRAVDQAKAGKICQMTKAT